METSSLGGVKQDLWKAWQVATELAQSLPGEKRLNEVIFYVNRALVSIKDLSGGSQDPGKRLNEEYLAEIIAIVIAEGFQNKGVPLNPKPGTPLKKVQTQANRSAAGYEKGGGGESWTPPQAEKKPASPGMADMAKKHVWTEEEIESVTEKITEMVKQKLSEQ